MLGRSDSPRVDEPRRERPARSGPLDARKNGSLARDGPGDGENGYRGCQGADTLDSPVFDRLILVHPWGPDGWPVYPTVRELTSMNPP